MRRAVFAAALAFCVSTTAAGAAAGQDWAKANLARSPRHGEFVTIDEPGGRRLQAWVIYPEVKEKAPVVVMIHEIFGLSDWAREMADELAGAGYIVVEPDLLSGFGAPLPPGAAHSAAPPSGSAAMGTSCDPMPCAPGQKPPVPAQQGEHAPGQMPAAGAAYVPASPGGTAAFPDQSAVVKAVSSLPDAQVLADLDAAADYGKKLPAASGKLFVAGFCWGGGKSFLFATHRKDLSGAFVFYGPPPPAELMTNITAPVYGFYAGNDARITSTVPQTEKDMKAAGKTYEPVIYDGAGHGFMRAGEAPDANAPNTAARQQGFRRLVKLLGGVH
jgi:carboxymethylenebutenolidase